MGLKTCIDNNSLIPANLLETCTNVTDGNCYQCLATHQSCSYCDGQCLARMSPSFMDRGCFTKNETVLELDQCPDYQRAKCQLNQNCQQCHDQRQNCVWALTRCVSYNEVNTITGKPPSSNWTCANEACLLRTSCGSCAATSECMWCMNDQRCFPSDSYVYQYPYGQCLQWHSRNLNDAGNCPKHRCLDFLDTRQCQTHPGCGWCDSGGNTGIGTCMEGALSGPLKNESCPNSNWYFVGEAPCPCNGHSFCNETGECVSCGNHTDGDRCQRCQQGWFGEARNGGKCQLCECPQEKATGCDNLTGDCRCRVKGVTGPKCDTCRRDSDGYYVGDVNSLHGNGTCYYPVQQGYQYTFRMETGDDLFVDQLNFLYNATRPAEFTIRMQVSSQESLNIPMATMRIALGEGVATFPEENLVTFENSSAIEYVLTGKDLRLDENINNTLRIYLTDFKPPVIIRVCCGYLCYLVLNTNLVLLLIFCIYALINIKNQTQL